MPLVPRAEDPRHVRSVHDGAMFADEIANEDARTPEANRFLIEGLNLDPIRPIFVSPRCSHLQVCSDNGVLGCNWMHERARRIHERKKSLVSEEPDEPFEVTPPVPASMPKPYVSIKAWSSRVDEGDDEEKSPEQVARRKLSMLHVRNASLTRGM